MIKPLRRLLPALGLSLLVLAVFFGKNLLHLNSIYFSAGGDGFKSYYGSLYHIRYDTLASRTVAMNYPFGEMTAFTDNQPLVTDLIRFADHRVADVDRYTVGMINGAMLLAFVLGVLFLFLILAEAGVSWWFGALASVGIAMLSPQVARMGGHYSLSWLVWLPALVYWMIRFERSRSAGYVLLTGVTVWLAGRMHLYFVGFAGLLTGGYWLWRFVFYKKSGTLWYRDLLFLFIQLFLPLVLIQSGILLNDTVTDRTAYPYGFHVFMGHPAAVFLPSGKPWVFVREHMKVFDHISWEALSWIGTAATAGLLGALVVWVAGRVRKQTITVEPARESFLLFFWISVAVLLFSFGIPFIFGLGNLADQLGPVRQLRALGRFAWLFYYMANLLVFAGLYRLAFRKPASAVWKTVAFAALALLWYEGSWNMLDNTRRLNNRIPELEDRENTTEANQWVSHVNAAEYQAIIPLPYFHVGSENIWIDATHQVKETAMVASLKTGLPLTGVELSRTSLSQTFLLYSLFTEPLERLELPAYLPDGRPFLVLRMNGYQPGEADQRLLEGASELFSNDRFTLLRLPADSIGRLHENWRRKVIREFEGSRKYARGSRLFSDTAAFFRVWSFNDRGAFTSLRGDGAFTLPARSWETLCEDTLKGVPPGTRMILGFWIHQYRKDGYLRGNLELIQKKESEEKPTGYFYSDFFRHLAAFQDDWALVEFGFETRSWDEIIKLSVRNDVLPDRNYTLDELMLRQEGPVVWEEEEPHLYRNGRKFRKL